MCHSHSVLHAGSGVALPVFMNSESGTLHLSNLVGKVPSMASLLEAGGQPGELSNLPGFGLVPPKLIHKILAREYIDIWELLPETWQIETGGTQNVFIAIWLQI